MAERKHEQDEPQTYDIVEPIDEEPVTRFDPARARHAAPEDTDAGVDLDIDTEVSPPPPSGADYSLEGSGAPRPKLLEGIPEPKFVDPQVQATRREEARIRAAQEAAEEDARRRQVKWKIIGALLIAAAVIAVWVWVFVL